MVSEASNDLRYLNLVTRVMDNCLREDDEEIFRYPATVTAAEFVTARRTMSPEKFPEFMDYMKREKLVEYYSIETMLKKGYRWQDPFSSDFGGSILHKLAYGPEFILRSYRDHEFQRTGDYIYACSSTSKIGNVALVFTLLYGVINQFSLLLSLWQITSSIVSSEKLISAQITGNDDFEKIAKKYSRIHKRTRFFILDEIQDYILNDI
ncbi:hypothetical protein KY335_02805 [Candidatus Woesearchaeota archaeon]|nr:hypothetical protein [Candidatus Woesearchaeota archaeon]